MGNGGNADHMDDDGDVVICDSGNGIVCGYDCLCD